MKKNKKLFVAALAAACAGFFTFSALSMMDTRAATVANEADYCVYGGSVRVTDAKYGPGVKFHITMTMGEFAKYGQLNDDGKTATLNGYTSGMLLMPYSLTNGFELEVDGTGYKATLSDSDTTDLWYKTTFGNTDYMQTVIYLYNIPKTDYGTEMAVRGYLMDSDGNITYTEQVNTISMSKIAKAEYESGNSALSASELETLKAEYIDKTVTVHVDGVATEYDADYLSTAEKPVVPARQADSDKFVGWFTRSGNPFDFKQPVKNNTDVYARYEESIVLSDDTQSYPVMNYARNANDTVVSLQVKLGQSVYDLGSNPDNLTIPSELTAATREHGSGTLVANMKTAAGKAYTLNLPTLVVTADIDRLSQIGVGVRDTNVNGSAVVSSSEFIFKTTNYAPSDCGSTGVEAALFGYYRVTQDLGRWVSGGDFAFAQWVNDGVKLGNKNAGAFNHPLQGFRGTFDGAGHTIVGYAGTNGLFGQVGQGAVIKDVNIKHGGFGNNPYGPALGASIINATLENVSFKLVGSSANSTTATQNVGFITRAGASGSTFTNVTVDARGLSLISIFGGHYWSGGYESLGNQQNTYHNFRIYANAVGAMGYAINTSTTAVTDNNVLTTVEEEIAEGNDITLATAISDVTAALNNKQVIVASDTTTWAIDLGDYASYTVQDITLGGVSVGNDPDMLKLPDSVASDPATHGDAEFSVTLALPNTTANSNVPETFTMTLNVPALIVTADIETKEEFEEIFTYADTKAYYGYYRLANDIGDENWNFNASGRGGKNCEWRLNGFRGTFDGNGYSIYGKANGGGLFGYVGQGAVIRNVDIYDYGTNGGASRSVLATTIANATVENVNITICPTTEPTLPTANQYANGVLASQWSYGTTYKDVTVDAELNKLYALFGSIWYGGYEHLDANSGKTPVELPNTYENVVVNAGALSYIGYWYEGSTAYNALGTFHGITEEEGVTLNVIKLVNDTATVAKDLLVMQASEAVAQDFAISLGEGYENFEVQSITLGEFDLGTDLNNLDVSGFATDLPFHGENKTITVVGKLSQYHTRTVTVPVDIVTMAISTKEEFSTAFTMTESKAYYGYYTLANDIGSENMGGGQPWKFGATAAADAYGGRGNTQPEYTLYGWRGTFNGNGYTITGRAANGGLFGLIGKGAVIKNFTIVDVYNNGCNASASLLAGFASNATVENVTFRYKKASWAAETVVPTNPEANQFLAGWIVHTSAYGMTFNNCTVDLAGYDMYSLFGSGWYAGYEHTDTNKTPIENDNVFNNFIIHANSLRYIGYWYEGSTAWNALGTFHGVTYQDENAEGSTISYNGSLVDREVSLQNRQQIVMQGAKARSALELGAYADKEWTSATLELENGSSYLLAEDSVAVEDIYSLIPAEVKNDVTVHGDQTLKLTYTEGIKNMILTVPVTLVTLEITTADELARFLRDYASVAKDEVFMGFTAAGQTATDADRTFRWEGTNVYDGYFTLGNDIDYSTHVNEDKSLNVYTSGGQLANPYDASLTAIKGAYWYPMGIDFLPGNEEKGFRGVFDGMGYTINGFSVYNYKAGVGKSTSGLIAKMHKDGVLRNVGFTNAKAYLGPIVSAWGNGTIENIYLQYSSNIIANTFNTHNYVVGVDAVTELNAIPEQLSFIKNSVIDISALASVKTIGGYLGYTSNAYKNAENVIFYGGVADGAGIAHYNNSLAGEQGFYMNPMGMDSFNQYTDVGELLRNHTYAINGWDSSFEARADGVYFGGVQILSGAKAANPTQNYLISTDKTDSDYVLVYDEKSATVAKMASFLVDQIQRASGTVNYFETTSTQGVFEEKVVGGVTLNKTIDMEWDPSARYIVLGDMELAKEAGVSVPDGYDYTIQWQDNSLFILANDELDYNAAVIRFLEETVGFRGLSDDYSAYTDFGANGLVLSDSISWTLNGNVAFKNRSQTNYNNTSKMDVKGINGTATFTKTGPFDANGKFYNTHNSMYWLPNNTTMYPVDTSGNASLPTNYAVNSNWYNADTRDQSTYTAYDLCYTATNTKANSDGVYTANDSCAYDQMVYFTAQHMLNVLNALDPTDSEAVKITFGCMDDFRVNYTCSCSGCSSYNGGAATPLVTDFLNRVIGEIAKVRENFIVYMLAYYYLEDPANVTLTATAKEHMGVIYAPIARTTSAQGGTEAKETKSIYDSANAEVRARIVEWSALVDRISFWFYDTLYSHFMMPTDTFRSMLTWIEYAARTCQNDQIDWINVNGQTAVWNPTGFEEFKAYTVQKAEIEILEKVTVDGSNANYDTQIDAYLTELENEFFGRNADGTFNNDGYYGPAAANQAMYSFYTQLKADYQAKVADGTLSGSVVDDTYSDISYKQLLWTRTYTFAEWLSEKPSDYYMECWSKSQINVYMNYLETAMAAVQALDDSNPLKVVYKRHVLTESIFPRFVICMGNNSSYWSSGFNHSGASYWTGTLANARAAFKTDCTELGITKYAEHGDMSAVCTVWGV